AFIHGGFQQAPLLANQFLRVHCNVVHVGCVKSILEIALIVFTEYFRDRDAGDPPRDMDRCRCRDVLRSRRGAWTPMFHRQRDRGSVQLPASPAGCSISATRSRGKHATSASGNVGTLGILADMIFSSATCAVS